jgi:glyoxylase-like metal-dependent hydrolase (beta-lactamase superfamily II)
MIEIIPTGRTGAECFLLVSENGAFLVDTGYAFCAEATVRNIARALDARPLDCILLTHSHFDHIDGLSAIRRVWPDAEVIGSHYVRDVLSREKARQMIRVMDDDAAAQCGETAAQGNYTDELMPDMTVGDGDMLRIGGASIRVMEMPGHTKCSVSYHFQEDDLLVLCETPGVKLREGDIVPAFVVNYAAAIRAIDQVESLAPRRILISHFGVASGDEVMDYLQKARTAAQDAAALILKGHDQGKSIDDILDDCAERFYIASGRMREGFLGNMRAMIPRLLAEMGRD